MKNMGFITSKECLSPEQADEIMAAWGAGRVGLRKRSLLRKLLDRRRRKRYKLCRKEMVNWNKLFYEN